MAKFKNGDSVIFIHDFNDMKQGDVCVVLEAQTSCCGNVRVDKTPYHIEPNVLELYTGAMPSEYVIGINKETLMQVLDRLVMSGTMASVNGMVPVEYYKQEMIWALDKLGVREDWQKRHV